MTVLGEYATSAGWGVRNSAISGTAQQALTLQHFSTVASCGNWWEISQTDKGEEGFNENHKPHRLFMAF